MPDFNLIDEPWIPCVMLRDSACQEFGLLEALLRADQIREIHDPSPLVTLSLYRLLLAVLHRNFGPPDADSWHVLWRRGSWDRESLIAYFARWHERFNLFDEHFPFFQVPFLPDTEAHSAAILSLELASGSSATLFDHSRDDQPKLIHPAEAARRVISRQSFSIGFGNSTPFRLYDAPLTRGITLLAQGPTLFTTLALNLLPTQITASILAPNPIGMSDAPYWEHDYHALPDPNGTTPRGWLDYLTWQSRHIHLIPTVDPARGAIGVRQCQLRQGLRLSGIERDPFKIYARNKEGILFPRRPDNERGLWRDSHLLLFAGDTVAQDERPTLLTWLASHGARAAQEAGLALGLSAFGLVFDPGKAARILTWYHERLVLPPSYMLDLKLGHRLRRALGLAEAVGDMMMSMRNELGSLTVGISDVGQGKLAPQEPAASLAMTRRYWSELAMPYHYFLHTLAAGCQLSENGTERQDVATLLSWGQRVRASARFALSEAVQNVESSYGVFGGSNFLQIELDQRVSELVARLLNEEGSGAQPEQFDNLASTFAEWESIPLSRTSLIYGKRRISLPSDREKRFVAFLVKLAALEGHRVLRIFRDGLSNAPEAVSTMQPYVAPFLRTGWEHDVRRGDNDSRFYLVASLFAWYRSVSNLEESGIVAPPNFGASLAALGRTDGYLSPALITRTSMLLSSSHEQLWHQLRYLVQMLKSRSIQINWVQLLHDIGLWNLSNRPVQREWARAFWHAAETRHRDSVRGADLRLSMSRAVDSS